MKGNQTLLQLMFFSWSQQRGLERMMMCVSLASNEYGDWARAPAEAQWRLVGGAEKDSCGPSKL